MPISNAPSRRPAQSGFTLIEILIAMSLGLVVLGGIISIMMPAVSSWRTAAAISSIQDIEQVAHDRMGQKIRQSSLMACGGSAAAGGVDIAIGISSGTIGNNDKN